MDRLKGKAILVAGAGAIGNGLAARYAQEGAGVVLGDIKLETAQAKVDEIVKAGGKAVAVQLDGADEKSIAAAVALCKQTYGGVDGLHVNFAAFLDHANDVGVLDIDMDKFDETIRINMRGFVLCTRAALPEILKRGSGSIIYTSSIAAYRGEPTRLAYAMSKAAMLALMRHVATRHGPDGVRCNAIAPGAVLRPGQETVFGPELMKWATSIAQLKSRIGNPGDIASVGALLMSDEGSFITGQVIAIDGGATMRA